MTKSEILSKFGKLFAAAGGTAGILQGIHYAADGSAVVTNRHYLLRIQGAHSFSHPITLHAKTGQPLEGTYPDTSKIFPTSCASEIRIPRKSLADALLAAQCVEAVATRLNKRVPLARLVVDGGSAYLDIECELPFPIGVSTRISKEAPNSDSRRSLNAGYMATALAVFTAAETDVTIKMNKPIEPIVISNDSGIDVLILPYRVPEQGESA
ncbi:hypothetical protein COLU111180_06320 [Cohnella lubricantis]